MLKLNLQFFAADALAGTWVFNDTVSLIDNSFTLSFISNSVNYTKISVLGFNDKISYYAGTQSTIAYNVDGWRDTAYKTIEISSKLSEVENGDKLLAWLQSNATKTAEAETESSSAVTISYNDSVIASLEAGQTATVSCSGKIMQGDMVIAVPEAEEIVLQEKTVTPTEAVQEVTPDEGNTALSKVTVNAIPNEYIVPSGEMVITENGAYNVVQYASVSANVPIPDGYIIPSGEETITENGSYDVTEKASVVVNVEDSPIPTEVSTEADMTALLTSGEVGGIYKYTGTTGIYENGAYYVLEEEAESSGYEVTFDITLPSAVTCDIFNNTLGFSHEFNSGNASSHIVETVTVPATPSLSDGLVVYIYDKLPTGGTSVVTGGIEQSSSDWGMASSNVYHITGDGTITITIDGWD